MFKHSNSRNGRNKESKVKRLLQAALLLAVLIWLLHQITKKEGTGSEEIKLNIEDVDVDIGRKGKAGSENVIILDGSKESFGMSETSETEYQSGDINQKPEKDEEESHDKGQENFQDLTLNDGRTETQEDQISNKINYAGSNAVDQDEANDNVADDDHKNEKDALNEMVTVAEINNVTEEAITSDQEIVLSSQLDGGEESEGEKVANDSRGAIESDNRNSGEESEVEKVTIDSQDSTEPETGNGGEISMEDVTNNANSDDEHGNPSFPNVESTVVSNMTGGSRNADFNSDNGITIDSETSDLRDAETVNSDLKTEDEVVNHPDTTENEAPKGEAIESTALGESTEDSNDNEVPKREATESTSLSESTDDNPSVEDANTKSDEDSMKTYLPDTKLENTELLHENISVESHGDDASGAEATTTIDVEAEKTDTEPNPDSTESHSDESSGTENAGDNFSAETSETKISEDASNSNDETPNLKSIESQGYNDSDGDDSRDIVSENSKTEESLNAEISVE